jgi:hypothetical protein
VGPGCSIGPPGRIGSRKTSPETTAAIVAARIAHHAGPLRVASILGIAASTIGAVLARVGMPRLADIDRLTGDLLARPTALRPPLRTRRPWDLLHVKVKKLGRVLEGGGWRIHG